jgi:hypothetical protein
VKRIFSILPVIVLLACSNAALASDGFGSVSCKSDISKALVGRTMSNEPVVAIEQRHKNLGLEDLGGSDVTDSLFLASWRICGDEYQLLEENDVVRDVVKFPAHSRESPEFIGSCQVKGKEMPGTIIAVLQDRKGAKTLSATAAWKVDESGKKFVKLPAEGLLCPRDGVITGDGGP